MLDRDEKKITDRENKYRRLGFDMTLTCTREGEIYRREERGERREKRDKMGFSPMERL